MITRNRVETLLTNHHITHSLIHLVSPLPLKTKWTDVSDTEQQGICPPVNLQPSALIYRSHAYLVHPSGLLVSCNGASSREVK